MVVGTITKSFLIRILILWLVTLLLLNITKQSEAQRTETFRYAAQYLSDVTAAHFFGDASYLEIQDNSSKFPNNSLEWILSNFSHGYLTDNNSSDWHSSLYPALSPAASDRNIIQPQSSGIVPFTIKGALGQTADVFQILDNSDNRTFRLTAEGYLETEGGIHPGYTTSTTSGNIRFTGSDIEGYVGGSWKSLTAGNILEGSGVIKGGSPSSGNVAYWDTINSITGLDGFRYDQANTQLIVEGTVSASQLKSTTTTVPPLTVQSNQKVTNLNSDLLDGYDSSYFLSGRNITLIGGDTSTSTYTVNNPYGHRNVFVEVIEVAPPYNRVLCTKSLPTTNTVQITFSSPQSIQYAVIIEEAEDNTLFGPGLIVEHSLNSTDILFQVWRNSGDYEEIVTGAEITSANYITIITSTVFSSNEGNVVFKTARDSVNIGDTASELINHEWNTRFFLSMMMDNSSNEISFAGTRFNKLDEIEIDFSSTPGADAIKFLYYPILATPDNNDLYILLSGANKDKVSGTHFNPSVNIDVGAVTANIITVTGEIYSSGEPDSIQTQLDNITANYSLNTHDHNPDDILSLTENGLVERVGTNDYRIREVASSSPIINNATTIPTSDAIYDWVIGLGYITDGNTNWDNIYGFVTTSDDTVQGSELDGVFSTIGLLKRTGTSTYTTITDNSANWNTAYSWGNHASAGYIKDGNTNWDNIYGFITSPDDSVSGSELDGVFSTTGLLERTGTSTYVTRSIDNVGVDNGQTSIPTENAVYDFVTSRGYITSANDSVEGSELDGVFSTTGLLKRTGPATYTTITDNSSNWNTAYSWGNHASAGYIKDGNTNWDNIYGFITSPDDSVSGSELDGVFSSTGLLERTGVSSYTTRGIDNTSVDNGQTSIPTENAVYDFVTGRGYITGITNLHQIGDVPAYGANGTVLGISGGSPAWITVSGGVTDHGALTGLDDNDHGAIYYTKTEVNTRLNGKANVSHGHDAGEIVTGLLGIKNGGTNNRTYSGGRFLWYNLGTNKIESSPYAVETTTITDGELGLPTENAVYDWVTGLGYITSSALTPYLKKDGSVAMTGNLNMNGRSIIGGANGIFSGSLQANTLFANSIYINGIGGVSSEGVFNILTDVRWNGSTLQFKSRTMAIQGGIVSLLGAETGWTNVP